MTKWKIIVRKATFEEAITFMEQDHEPNFVEYDEHVRVHFDELHFMPSATHWRVREVEGKTGEEK